MFLFAVEKASERNMHLYVISEHLMHLFSEKIIDKWLPLNL